MRLWNWLIDWICDRFRLCGLDMNEYDLMSHEW